MITAAQEAVIADAQISDLGVATLANLTKQELPWLLAVGLHRPHLPFLVSQRMLDLYPEAAVKLPHREAPTAMPDAAGECAGTYNDGPTGGCQPGQASFELWQQYSFNGTVRWNGWNGVIGSPMPEAWALELRRFYLAAASFADEKFGKVLDALAAAQGGAVARTAVTVLVGDHGWHLGEQGMWAKCTEFDAATRAPVMIRVPGVTDGGMITRSFTEHVDLLPTVLAAAGLPPIPVCPPDSRAVSRCTEGVSVLPLAQDPQAVVKKAAITQWPHPFGQQPAAMGYSIRTTTFRYTEWVLMDYTANGTHLPNWGVRPQHAVASRLHLALPPLVVCAWPVSCARKCARFHSSPTRHPCAARGRAPTAVASGTMRPGALRLWRLPLRDREHRR